MAWMEGLAGAERAKMSVLRYGIARYIQSQLPEIDPVYKIRVMPLNDEVIITGTNPTVEPAVKWELTVPYPAWLVDFLDDDDRFELLLPGCEEKLEEVLQRIYEWCQESDEYRPLITPV